jgi:hypothetical protein
VTTTQVARRLRRFLARKPDKMASLPRFDNRFCPTWRAGKRAALARTVR